MMKILIGTLAGLGFGIGAVLSYALTEGPLGPGWGAWAFLIIAVTMIVGMLFGLEADTYST